MKIGAYLTGAFGQSKELYLARNEVKRQRAPETAADAQIIGDTRKIIGKQADAGLSFIIDPMFRFYYLFQPFAEKVTGVKVGAQENWFNNNVFYWIPEISGLKGNTTTGFIEKYIHTDLLPKGKEWSVVLPSPYTLLLLSKFKGVNGFDLSHIDKKFWIGELSELIYREAQHLADMGFSRIQYDEPALVALLPEEYASKQELSLLESALEKCGKIRGATTSLQTYFGDAGPLLPFLSQLNVDCIGIDATETRLRDILNQKFSGKELAIGLVDSRSASIENPDELIGNLERIAERSQPKALWLTPNAGTEYVLWPIALQKLEVISETLRRIGSK